MTGEQQFHYYVPSATFVFAYHGLAVFLNNNVSLRSPAGWSCAKIQHRFAFHSSDANQIRRRSRVIVKQLKIQFRDIAC